MSKALLHTPVGVRDVYGKECAVKLTIENNINKVFNLYGYHNIQTPTFEFFDIFNKERGSVASKNLYKFFDREGNTLVLRPDITPSIARLAAKYYMDVNVPIKLCYNANTYVNNSELQGKLKENTQLGCELINDDSVEADAEMIALVVESLKASGLEEFLVEIGHVDFYNGLIEEIGGPATPGVGFAFGMERLLLALDDEEDEDEDGLDCYIMPLGEEAKDLAMQIIAMLRANGFTCEMDHVSRGLKGQFKSADRFNAHFSIILGEEEVKNEVVNIKCNHDKEQVVVPLENILAHIENHLSGGHEHE